MRDDNDMWHSDYAIAACRYIKRALFFSCRYPAFTNDYIRTKIERPGTRPEELRDYQANGVHQNRGRTSLLMLLYIAYGLKNLFLVYETLQVFDYNNYEANIKPAALSEEQLRQMNYSQPSETLKIISCLISNCTRLSPPSGDSNELLLLEHTLNYMAPQQQQQANNNDDLQLADDFSKLPLFLMCHPILDRAYTPVDKLDAFGIFAFLVSMYTVMLLGCCITLQQMFSPASNDAVMFITSPRVTARQTRERAWELLRDLTISCNNYRLFSAWKQRATKHEQSVQSLAPNKFRQNNHSSTPRALHCDRCPTCFALMPSKTLTEFKATLKMAPIMSLDESYLDEEETTNQGGEKMSDEEEDDDFWVPMAATKDLPRNTCEPLVASMFRKSPLMNKSRKQIRHLLDCCMPIVRTPHWRPKAARIMAKTLVNGLTYIGFLGLFSFGYIQLRVVRKKALLEEFERYMSMSNCYIWLSQTKSLDVAHAIPIGHQDLDWTMYAIWETLGMNYVAAFSVSFMFAVYWMLMCEIGTWLAELRMFFVASLLVTRFNHDHERRQEEEEAEAETKRGAEFDGSETCPAQDASTIELAGQNNSMPEQPQWQRARRRHFLSSRQFYNIPKLRKQFQNSLFLAQLVLLQRIEKPGGNLVDEVNDHLKEASNLAPPSKERHFGYHLLNSQDVDRCHSEHFLAQMLIPLPEQLGDDAHHYDCTDFDIETLEQIYVNLRLLVEYVHSLKPSIMVIMTITYLLNYGYVCVAIICRRKFSGLADETLFVIVVFFTIANLLIFMSANFHANAKKLQPLLWSIIAYLTYSKSLRVRHMRSLWLKQVLMMDNEGGLGLKWLGMRVTYVYIIQLLIWTATICAIALKSTHVQEE